MAFDFTGAFFVGVRLFSAFLALFIGRIVVLSTWYIVVSTSCESRSITVLSELIRFVVVLSLSNSCATKGERAGQYSSGQGLWQTLHVFLLREIWESAKMSFATQTTIVI